MRKTAPCKGCEYRTQGCHDKCEPYQDFRRTRELINTNKAKEFKEINGHIESVERTKH